MPRQLKRDFFADHPTQDEFLASGARFKVASCGRRWGKGNGALREAGQVSVAIPGGRTWIISPSYEVTKPMWRKALLCFGSVQANGRPWMLKPRIKNREIPFLNGSVLEFKSADDPDSLRGAGDDLVHVILDEAAYIDKDTWGIISFAMADNVASAALISTPNRHQPKNWFYEMWLRGRAKLRETCPECDGRGCPSCKDGYIWKDNEDYDPTYESFQFSSFDNPHMPAAEIERMIRDEKFNEVDILREVYGEFVGGETQVFGLGSVRDCVAGEEEPPRSDSAYVTGVDLGRVESFTVITTIRIPSNREETPRVVAFERFQGGWSVQRERIAQHARRFGQPRMFVDSTGIGETFQHELRQAGVQRLEPVKFSGVSKPEMLGALLAAIDTRAFTWPPNPQLERELLNLEQRSTPSGVVQYRAGRGHTDDCVMSLALAWWGYLKTGSPQCPKLWAIGVGSRR